MDWGVENRLARIVRPETGRAVMLAADHGYFLGPVSRLEDPRKTLEPLLPYTDSLMVTRGVLRRCVDPTRAPAIVLRVSGGVSIAGPALEDESITTSIEEAARLNAAAVAVSIFVGTPHESKTLGNLAEAVDRARPMGIPVLAVTAVGKELEKLDARYLALCCRMAAEIGADLVKTYYCEGFDRVAGGCPVPVVIAGGPKLETELDALRMTADALARGAVGVDMGRNIWQSERPAAMIRAVRTVVHDGARPEEALELFESLKA
jgi:putative autoinducer-2 (AI-2) aldolase